MLTEPQKTTIVTNCVFPALAVFVTGLRLYARKLNSVSLHANDFTILAALAFTLGTSISVIYGSFTSILSNSRLEVIAAKNGFVSANFEGLNHTQTIMMNKFIYGLQFPVIFAVSLAKLSVLLFYGKVFIMKSFQRIVRIIEGIVIIWTIITFFATLFQVYPIGLNWNPDKYQQSPIWRLNQVYLYLAVSYTELILNVITLILPWPVIWRLQMNTRRKWAASGIFALGGLVCVASAHRVYYLHFIHKSANQYLTYEAYDLFIWTSIEPGLGIICASLPLLGPIFTASTQSTFGSIFLCINFRTPSTRNNSNHDRSNTNITGPLSPQAETKGDQTQFMANDAIITTST